MAVAELPRPGVEIVQQFRSTTPTVVTPTLAPCIVGVCRQVVEAVEDGSLNSDALLQLPGALLAKAASGDPPRYTTLNSTTLGLSVAYGATVVVTFSGTSLSPADVVSQVQDALETAGVSDFVVETVGTDQWRIRTISTGEFSSIRVMSGSSAALTAFGWFAGMESVGASSYGQWGLTVQTSNYPDPRSNLGELTIEIPSVAVYLALGTSDAGTKALSQTSSLLSRTRSGDAVAVTDDGNGDTLTPIVRVTNGGTPPDFTATGTAASAAVVTGAGAPNYTLIDNKTLILSDGRAPKTITFGTIATITDVITAINAVFDPNDGIVASDNGSGFVRLTSTVKREDGTTTAKGHDSVIAIVGGTAVEPTNYLDTGVTPTLVVGKTYGNPYAAAIGDEFWVDGVKIGNVVQVAPGGVTNALKLDKQVSLSFTGTKWYIQAKNCASGTVTRPRPDLTVDSNGNCTVKHEILRDPYGAPVEQIVTLSGADTLVPAKALMYLAYEAIRKDVSAMASSAGLVTVDTTTEIEDLLAPISTKNPLALGLYFASLNAPGAQVSGLGVDEVTADAPYGTVEAFTRAAEFLEAVEVYAIAPLTHDDSVAQVFNTHVNSMSEPESKGERIVIWNGEKPTAALDTLVASGLNGLSAPSANQFDTGIVNLSALLIANDIDPTTTVPATDGLFLDIASDSKRYSISAVSGSVVTLRTSFTGSDNIDSFYTTDSIDTDLLNEAFSIKLRGAKLVQADGVTPNKAGIAEAYTGKAQTFQNRRFWSVVPDKCAATLDGVEQIIEGFYMCAAVAGMIGQLPPQQSFTNYPMTGFTKVIGSNDFFTNKQLDQIAAGGNYIIVQDAAGAPLTARMALTTDLTSIETRTDSIQKVVDFSAKFLRKGLKNFIGRFNITQGFLDTLGHVIQGLLTFLQDNGVLIGAQLNNIVQDENAPDTVLVDVTLDVPFPCNYLRLTLTV